MRIKLVTLLQLLFVIIFIALLEPNGLTYSSLHGAVGIVRYSGFFIAIAVFFLAKIYKEKIPMLLIAILVWMGISTYLYSGELSDGYTFAFRTIFTATVLSAYSLKKFPRFYIMMMSGILSLWLFMDGFTWQQGGVYVTANGQMAFFLGTRTSITYYLVPALAFDYVALKVTKNQTRLLAWIFNIMAIVGSIIYLSHENVSTGVLCLTLGLIGYVVIDKFDHIIKWICKYGFTVTSVFNFMIISGNVLNVFKRFFVNVLNESAELNGRTQIWKMVLSFFENRPMIGYGYSSGIKFDVWQSFNSSTHNYFLYLLFTMGIIGFMLYLIYVVVIHHNNKLHLDENICRYLMLILVIMNIEAISETYGFNVMTFCVLVTLGYVKNLIEVKQIQRQRFKLFGWHH